MGVMLAVRRPADGVHPILRVDEFRTANRLRCRVDERTANPYPRWCRRAGALSLFGVAVLVVGGFVVGPALAIPGLLIGVLSAVPAFAWWIAGQHVETELARWRAGQALATWELSADQFAPWWAARRLASRRGASAAGALVMSSAGVFALLAWEDGDIRAAQVALAVGTAGAAVVLGVLRQMERPPAAGPVLVVIGQDGGFVGGELVWWRGFGIRLVGAEVASGPAFRVVYRVTTRSGEVEHVCVIPAPPEARAQVEEAVAGVLAGGSPA